MRARAAVPAWLLIAGAELSMMRRSPATLILAAVLPTALGLLIVWAENDTGRGGRGAAAGLILVTLLALTAYTAGTTALVARRQQFVLKRLRMSGASDAAIVAGVLTPPALLTLLQTVVLFSIMAAAGGPAPDRPAVLAAAIAAGIVAACVLAVATAAFTGAPELAQLTTSPVTLAFVGGGFWVVRTPPADVTWLMLALPGGSVTQLARIAWPGPATGATTAIAALLLLTAAGTPLAVRIFRWDPRRET